MSVIYLPSPNKLGVRFGKQPGYSLNDGFHYGQDFMPGPDIYVYLPEDGQVGTVFNNGNDGNALYLWAENRKHALCHLERFLVQPGFYKRGTKVGIIGYTGYVEPAGKAGAHLHWSVQKDGFFVNPMTLIGGKGAAEPMLNEGDIHNIYLAGWGRKATDAELARYVGKPFRDAFYDDVKNQLEYLRKTSHDDDDAAVQEIKKIVEKL